MKIISYYILIFSTLLLCNACGKTDDPKPQPTPVEQTITKFIDIDWAFDRILENGRDKTDFFQDVGSKGMKVRFNTNFTYNVLLQGSAVFNRGSWVLETEKRLVINSLPNSMGRKTIFNIKSLTTNELVLEMDYQFDPINDPTNSTLIEVIFKK